jgi:hypothetical protein
MKATIATTTLVEPFFGFDFAYFMAYRRRERYNGEPRKQL